MKGSGGIKGKLAGEKVSTEFQRDAAEVEKLRSRLKQLEEAQDKLSEELWRIKRRRTFRAGLLLIVISAVIAVTAFFVQVLAVELVAVIAFFIGFLMLYTEVEERVPASFSVKALRSSLLPIQEIIEEYDVAANCVYIPPSEKVAEGKVFLAVRGEENSAPPSLEEVSSIKFEAKRGLALPPTGYGLYLEIEDKLGLKYRNYSLEDGLDSISRVMSDALELGRDFKILKKGDNILIEMVAMKYSALCEELTVQPNSLCVRIGCPICSALALTVAKMGSCYVFMEKAEYVIASDITKVAFKMGHRVR